LTSAVDSVRTNITPATANPATFEENIQFILSHCDEPLFPRTISTFATGGRQIGVNSFEEMMAMYEQGDYLDCRVNAYNNIDALHAPDLLFIDIDRSDFKSDRAHLIALRNDCMTSFLIACFFSSGSLDNSMTKNPTTSVMPCQNCSMVSVWNPVASVVVAPKSENSASEKYPCSISAILKEVM
jgi:hypothetical protein